MTDAEWEELKRESNMNKGGNLVFQPEVYDRMFIHKEQHDYEFFSQPRGNTVVLERDGVVQQCVKTFRDTNNEWSWCGGSWHLDIKKIGFKIAHQGYNFEKLNILKNEGYIHLRIVDRDMVNVPLSFFTPLADSLVYQVPFSLEKMPFENISVSLRIQSDKFSDFEDGGFDVYCILYCNTDRGIEG